MRRSRRLQEKHSHSEANKSSTKASNRFDNDNPAPPKMESIGSRKITRRPPDYSPKRIIKVVVSLFLASLLLGFLWMYGWRVVTTETDNLISIFRLPISGAAACSPSRLTKRPTPDPGWAELDEVERKQRFLGAIEQTIGQLLAFPMGETDEGALVTLAGLCHALQLKTTDSCFVPVTEKFLPYFKDQSKVESNVEYILSNVHLFPHLKSYFEESKKAMRKPVVDVFLPFLLSGIKKTVEEFFEPNSTNDASSVGKLEGSLEELVDGMIARQIAKLGEDKPGIPDLALESDGGSIIRDQTSQLKVKDECGSKISGTAVIPFEGHTRWWLSKVSVLGGKLLGFFRGFMFWSPKEERSNNEIKSFWAAVYWSPPNSPRTIIQTGVVPGECWSFDGSKGDILIKLAAPSLITGFTLEHVPKNNSRYGHISSAPKQFQVLGLLNQLDEEEAHSFGEFMYDDEKESLQYFPVVNKSSRKYPIVQLKVLSNHGNVKHTCVYRFRVHSGVPHLVVGDSVTDGDGGESCDPAEAKYFEV